jgi:hypothetical protein
MRQYAYVLLALLVGCAEFGGGRSSTSAVPPPPNNDQATGTAAPGPAAATRKRDKLEGIALVWKPTTEATRLAPGDLAGLENTRLQIAPVVDGRQEKSIIGENKEDAPKVRLVTTSDDVPAFVTQHMTDLVSRAGVAVSANGANRILKSELKAFNVEETRWYNGDVRLVVTLTDASGKTLWSGTTGGRAQRYGISYKADNYYETLSDSLIEATYYLLRNQSFHEALVVKP